jgi:hypothetical protein
VRSEPERETLNVVRVWGGKGSSQQTNRSSTCPGGRVAARSTTKQRAAGGLAVCTTFGRDLLGGDEVRRDRELKATVESCRVARAARQGASREPGSQPINGYVGAQN